MNNLSLAILDGNLTADPDSRELSSGKQVTTFTLAMNHEWGSKEGNKQVSYIQVEAWEKLAENCGKFLRKGNRVTVTGSIREDRWKDESGSPRSRVKVIAQSVRFDTPKKESEAA